MKYKDCSALTLSRKPDFTVYCEQDSLLLLEDQRDQEVRRFPGGLRTPGDPENERTQVKTVVALMFWRLRSDL